MILRSRDFESRASAISPPRLIESGVVLYHNSALMQRDKDQSFTWCWTIDCYHRDRPAIEVSASAVTLAPG